MGRSIFVKREGYGIILVLLSDVDSGVLLSTAGLSNSNSFHRKGSRILSLNGSGCGIISALQLSLLSATSLPVHSTNPVWDVQEYPHRWPLDVPRRKRRRRPGKREGIAVRLKAAWLYGNLPFSSAQGCSWGRGRSAMWLTMDLSTHWLWPIPCSEAEVRYTDYGHSAAWRSLDLQAPSLRSIHSGFPLPTAPRLHLWSHQSGRSHTGVDFTNAVPYAGFSYCK
ncbi:hypothetical protein E1301_Tti018232 [Triplophysa tibetana]|uniref:Uncharacterized protein n=1 Tax=Triplophysa tibetana TaxID=1572043 RepID=A0A5A9NQH6_9TELE|nr:hypothetical protein E1301_Tti018232 [Triplophysa tibetana]